MIHINNIGILTMKHLKNVHTPHRMCLEFDFTLSNNGIICLLNTHRTWSRGLYLSFLTTRRVEPHGIPVKYNNPECSAEQVSEHRLSWQSVSGKEVISSEVATGIPFSKDCRHDYCRKPSYLCLKVSSYRSSLIRCSSTRAPSVWCCHRHGYMTGPAGWKTPRY